jgi:methionyl-tRNA formyltransferase
MDATLDTGDMLLAASLPIAPDDTAGTLAPKLAALGARLLVETLDGLAAGTLPRRPQDDSQATYAPMITPEDSLIRWEEPGVAICNRIRGVSPKPGAFAAIKGRRVKIWGAQPDGTPTDAAPGTVLEPGKSPVGVRVAAGAGTSVLLTEAQPESGRRMPAADWARGQHLLPGNMFTPPEAETA